jgi:predicted pyridoxine 5'-phosphate oxidase superfamily flavin-nucleotide-binding protein
MSLGNILVNPHVGCLFIDFSDGARLRVNGRATIYDQGEALKLFPEARRVVVVEVEQVVPNCRNYVPRLLPVEPCC